MAKKAYYSTAPHVPKKKIAGTNPVGSVHLGPELPKMVPHKPGTTKALGDKPPRHTFGHGIHQHRGALRISAYASAHQVGYRAPKTVKVPKGIK